VPQVWILIPGSLAGREIPPEVTLSYAYFQTSKVETIASFNPNGASAAYAWDTLNRLLTVTDNRLPGENATNL
jgi:YD repeat-containing protein